ncbi:glycosyltransferase [Rubellimicrobium roseum]|uniref:Glycosyltransferase family 4 protein n=1 Tax=Rubellimicrobium roseum TaxID=687525 RepID=A0A5C4NMV5_9RHOB|nr:glycosyltransferase [Rubellimicrobium roseum]TNC74778.1 glycosyltransferase family 4 protein [Rubellimicrobium roseum]
MRLSVLSVAYPLAPVTADPVGGAEQVLARLDRALVARGHRSLVIACEGSRVAGDLRPIPAVAGPITDWDAERVRAAVRARIAEVVASDRPDVIHLHGIDFPSYLPLPGPPVLVTLHLPLDWYPPEALAPVRPGTHLHPVSAAQAATAPPGSRIEAPIENGVDIPDLKQRRRCYVFALGRICPEKGFDDALDAARLAHVPLLLAGTVFPYPDHERHFRRAIAPRLSWRRRWIGPVEGARKQALLANARCVLLPCKARETSSLVTMEALAAGTPVIAYPTGALPDIVEHGRTGFLVRDVPEMAEAIRKVGALDPETCRAAAIARFGADRMIEGYLRRYEDLAAKSARLRPIETVTGTSQARERL